MVRAWTALAAIGLALAAAGCASVPPVPTGPLRAWPDAPDAPRLVLERIVTLPEDAGIPRGGLRRFADFLLGAPDQRLVRPTAVLEIGAILYVADAGRRGIHRYDRAQERYDFVTTDDALGLPSPMGLCTGPGGEAWITDSTRKAVYSLGPNDAAVVPRPFKDLQQPTGIAFAPESGLFYITDTARHEIAVFDSAGRRLRTLGGRGNEAGRFNFPTLIARAGEGELWVTDTLNFRVQRIGADGRPLGSVGRHGDGTGDAARPKGIATDRHGHLYVVDALFHAFQVFDREGRLLLAVGEAGAGPGEFWLPTGIAVTTDDRILVADTYNRRIQIFRYLGAPT